MAGMGFGMREAYDIVRTQKRSNSALYAIEKYTPDGLTNNMEEEIKQLLKKVKSEVHQDRKQYKRGRRRSSPKIKDTDLILVKRQDDKEASKSKSKSGRVGHGEH